MQFMCFRPFSWMLTAVWWLSRAAELSGAGGAPAGGVASVVPLLPRQWALVLPPVHGYWCGPRAFADIYVPRFCSVAAHAAPWVWCARAHLAAASPLQAAHLAAGEELISRASRPTARITGEQ